MVMSIMRRKSTEVDKNLFDKSKLTASYLTINHRAAYTGANHVIAIASGVFLITGEVCWRLECSLVPHFQLIISNYYYQHSLGSITIMPMTPMTSLISMRSTSLT